MSLLGLLRLTFWLIWRNGWKIWSFLRPIWQIRIRQRLFWRRQELLRRVISTEHFCMRGSLNWLWRRLWTVYCCMEECRLLVEHSLFSLTIWNRQFVWRLWWNCPWNMFGRTKLKYGWWSSWRIIAAKIVCWFWDRPIVPKLLFLGNWLWRIRIHRRHWFFPVKMSPIYRRLRAVVITMHYKQRKALIYWWKTRPPMLCW